MLKTLLIGYLGKDPEMKNNFRRAKWKSRINLTNHVTGTAIPAMRTRLTRADEQSGYSCGF